MSMQVWDVLRLPSIADCDEEIPIAPDMFHQRYKGDVLHPERESRETLEALMLQLGASDFAAQYLLRPAPPGGAIVHWHWFDFYEQLFLDGGVVIQSWDTAVKAGNAHDYSVCTTWLYHDKVSYLLDVLRRKLEFPALNVLILEHAHSWKADEVIIEDAGSGSALIQNHRGCGLFTLWPNSHHGIDKVTRMQMETPAIERGEVLIKRNADWLADFKAEITQFPYAKHDDIVDSVSQYLKRVRLRGFPQSTFTPIGPARRGSWWDMPVSDSPGGLYL